MAGASETIKILAVPVDESNVPFNVLRHVLKTVAPGANTFSNKSKMSAHARHKVQLQSAILSCH